MGGPSQTSRPKQPETVLLRKADGRFLADVEFLDLDLPATLKHADNGHRAALQLRQLEARLRLGRERFPEPRALVLAFDNDVERRVAAGVDDRQGLRGRRACRLWLRFRLGGGR